MGFSDAVRIVTVPVDASFERAEMVPRLAGSYFLRSKNGVAEFALLAPSGPGLPAVVPTYETVALAMAHAAEWGPVNCGGFSRSDGDADVLRTANFGVVRLLKAARRAFEGSWGGEIAIGLITSSIPVDGAGEGPVLWLMSKDALRAARDLYGGGDSVG